MVDRHSKQVGAAFAELRRVLEVIRTQRVAAPAVAQLLELVEREIQVVPALEIHGSTLHQYQGFRFAVFPRHGGRAPELDDPATLEWIGRFIGRIHAVGGLST